MGARDSVATFWDEVVAEAAAGEAPHRTREELRRWFGAFAGEGRGAVDEMAMPEPYIGPLAQRHGDPRLVALGLNPGRSDLHFQGPDGVFAHEYGSRGGFSTWAVSEPYMRDPWLAAHGRNRYHHNLLRFAQRWLEDPSVQSRDVLVFELYPWHSEAVTATFRVDVDLVDRFIWRPIAELDAPEVFAFGAAWQRVAARLALRERAIEGSFSDRTRRARLFELPSGQRLVISWHQASNSPPSAADVHALRSAVLGDLPEIQRPIAVKRDVPTAPRAGQSRKRSGRPEYGLFWAQLQATIREEHPDWGTPHPNRNDLPLLSPLPGARIKCNFSKHGLRVELLLQSRDPVVNNQRLGLLGRCLPELCQAFGDDPGLVLEPLDGRVQARLAAYRPGTIQDERQWPAFQTWFLDVASRLAGALMIIGPVDWNG